MRNKLEYWRFKHALVVGILCCAGCVSGCVAGPATPLARSPAPPATVHFPQTYDAQPAPFIMPAPAWVADDADILSPESEASLTADLEALQERTGHQMVVVTIPGLGGENVADVALSIANCWAVGRASHDDGVLLLVAPNERRARISTGYGIEQYITDIRAQKIMDETLIPAFQKGDFDGGIKAGVAVLIDALDKVPGDTRLASAKARKIRQAQNKQPESTLQQCGNGPRLRPAHAP